MRMLETKPLLAVSVLVLLAVLAFGCATTHAQQSDPLPSWAEGSTKSALIQFVQDVTKKGGKAIYLSTHRTLWPFVHLAIDTSKKTP